MKKFTTTLAATMIAASGAFAGTTDCGIESHNVTFDYEHKHSISLGCSGIQRAIDFFEDMGYTGRNWNLNLSVHDLVQYEIKDANGVVVDYGRSFALFTAATNHATISSMDTDYMNNRTVWQTDPTDLMSGLPVTDAYWSSIVTHEIAHAITHAIYNETELNRIKASNGVYLPHGASEWIAYSVQISTLPTDLKNEVLAQFEGVTGFTNIENANSVRHFIHPHKFGVQSYLSFNLDWFELIVTGQGGAEGGM